MSRCAISVYVDKLAFIVAFVGLLSQSFVPDPEPTLITVFATILFFSLLIERDFPVHVKT